MSIMIERLAIVGCKTEVVIQHTIICTLIHTTIRQNRDWQCVWIIRVCIKILIGITNQRVAHSSIRLCLVRRVLYFILLTCCRIFYSSQSRKFQVFDWLVLQFTLKLCINKIDVNIVGFQLMQDIESCIVRMIISSWVKRTRSVQCIRIWVDIKVTLHLSRYNIYILAQCTRSFLVTITTATDNIE